MAKEVKFRTHTAHVKFPSIKAAAEAAGVPYMTFYMRMKALDKSPSQAFKTPVRKYRKTKEPAYRPGSFKVTPIDIHAN